MGISAGSRFYEFGGRKYPSVTTIIRQVEPKGFLTDYRVRVGVEEAERIRKEAAKHGSAVHCALEAYLAHGGNREKAEDAFVKRVEPEWLVDNSGCVRSREVLTRSFDSLIKPFIKILAISAPVVVEQKVTWVSTCREVGFGGTLDAIMKIPSDKLIFADGSLLKGKRPLLYDWKNFRKPKEPVSLDSAGRVYFPLISYCLQLAAYCFAYNESFLSMPASGALLVCAHLKCREAKIYYLSPQAMEWYWYKFMEALWCIHHEFPFDWIGMCIAAEDKNFLGNRLKIVK
jgi:hypothetical protein